MNKKQVESIVLSEFFDFVMERDGFSVKEEHQKLIDEEVSKFSILTEAEEEEVEADTAAGGIGDVQDVDDEDIISSQPAGGATPPPLPPGAQAQGPAGQPPGAGAPQPRQTGLGGIFNKLRNLGKISPEDARSTDQVTSGLVNKIGRAQANMMKKYMNFMYGTGVWDDPNDARDFTQQVQTNPGEASDIVLYNISNPAMRRTIAGLDRSHREMDINDMFSFMLKQSAMADMQQGGDGKPPTSLDPDDLNKDNQEGGEGGKVPKETPLSITKKQKDVEGLRSATGAAEVPLNAYIQKKLGFSAKSATRLAKSIGGAFKGKKIPIAERKIVDIYALILEENKNLTLEDLIDEKWESVGAQAEIEGGTKPYHKKLKKANDRLATLKDKMAAATSPGEKSKIQRAIRTVDARKDNLLRNLERVKGDKATSKADKKKAIRDAEKKGAKFGMIGKIMYKYAARQGEKDPEFMEKFGDDPTAQSKFIKKIRKMLRRQLTRRGYAAGEVDTIMKESFDVAIRAIMPPLVEHMKKQKLL